MNIVNELEKYIGQYVALMDKGAALPIALWVIATHCYMSFDAFPYIVITSPTKQSGKTRLMEIISFVCSNPNPLASPTAATLYRSIADDFPVILCDEAEILASEAASDIRAVLNIGYRRGTSVKRMIGNEVKEFDTYCPKVFVLIGDVYDTLRDRSIIITMKRADPKRRFLYTIAQTDGLALAAEIKQVLGRYDTAEGPRYHDTPAMEKIRTGYADFTGLSFLRDRDEEIWTPLFVLCAALCPERMQELTALAVDMSASKTGAARTYHASKADEKEAENNHYALQLLADMKKIMEEAAPLPKDAARDAHRKVSVALPTAECVNRLKLIPSSPWRTYQGIGLDDRSMTRLLSRFKIQPRVIRFNEKVSRGFDYDAILKASVYLEKKTEKEFDAPGNFKV